MLKAVFQVVSVAQVKFREYPSTMTRLESRVNERQGTLVVNGYIIQSTKINTRPQSLILLSHEEKTAPSGDEEARIIPESNDSVMYLSMVYALVQKDCKAGW